MTEYERIEAQERRTMRRIRRVWWLLAAALVVCDVIAYFYQ